MEENQRATSYKEVSAELGKKLIKLYGEKIFPRQGKVFADMLFQTGIEAGTYIASLADIDERSVKVNLATNAMIKLNQTAYLINVMKEAGYYAPVHVVDIESYMEELLKAMRNLLTAAFAHTRSDGLRVQTLSSAPTAPVGVQYPVAHTAQQPPRVTPASNPAPTAVPNAAPAPESAAQGSSVQPFDPDGFGDPVE